MSESTQNSFDEISARLEEIVSAVRSKDTSLERSLDLFDEAIRIGSKAVEMVDQFDLFDREAEVLDEWEPAASEESQQNS